jgi:polysaccharide biosynthesis/export protein
VRVQADGTVQLPLVGTIQAAEHTTAELSETVRDALKKGGYFADPVVTVEVVGYASRYVVVLGAVGVPGLIPINRPYRMSEILAKVGGVRADAADYLVVRAEKGDEKRFKITELSMGGPDQDPFVQPGDKIYAPTAELYYLYGKVNSPGAFPLRSALTVRQAIGQAGGLAENGSDKKVDVTRGGKKIHLNLDDPILPGDVVVVGERLF